MLGLRAGIRGVVAVLLVAALTACGGDSGSNDTPSTVGGPPAPTQATAVSELTCEGADCGADNREVKATPCSEPAVDAASEAPPTLPTGVSGVLHIRKSAAAGADCDRLYWAKLATEPDNTQAYVLSLRETDSDGRRVRVVRQESDNPRLEALTKSLKTRIGHKLEACVSGALKTVPACLTLTVV